MPQTFCYVVRNSTCLRYLLVALVSAVLTAVYLNDDTLSLLVYRRPHVAPRAATAVFASPNSRAVNQSSSISSYPISTPLTTQAPLTITTATSAPSRNATCTLDDITTCGKSPQLLHTTVDMCAKYGLPPHDGQSTDTSSWPQILPRHHDPLPDEPQYVMEIRILFSVVIADSVVCASCVADQALNLLEYAPNSAVVFHTKNQEMYWEVRRNLGDLSQRYLHRVLVNPQYVPYTALHQHVLNVKYGRKYFRMGHVVFYSSSDRLLRDGIESYLDGYDGVDYERESGVSGKMWIDATGLSRPRFVSLETLLQSGTSGPAWYTSDRIYCDGALRLAMRRAHAQHYPTAPQPFDGTFMSARTFAVLEGSLSFSGYYGDVVAQGQWEASEFYAAAILRDYLSTKRTRPNTFCDLAMDRDSTLRVVLIIVGVVALAAGAVIARAVCSHSHKAWAATKKASPMYSVALLNLFWLWRCMGRRRNNFCVACCRSAEVV